MKISQQRLTCKCGHVWDAEVVTDAPIAVCVASMKAIRCPACGSDKPFLGGAYSDNPGPESTIAERAEWWRSRGEIGTSSLTIWCAFTGGHNPHRDFRYPLDPDDFRRCKKLLDLIPEWLPQLSAVVVKRFPWFKPFADRWQEFDALYLKEAASGTCEKLYDAIQIAAKEAESLRRSAA